jgi:putative ABC transport system substrate-binding protein
MNRRDFITLLGGAAIAWPLAARAQQGGRVRRIGVLVPWDENDPAATTYVSAFTQGLAGLGWTDGRNVRVDLRWARGDTNRIRALAQELVGLQPDINPDNRDRCDRSLATGDADDPDRLCERERSRRQRPHPAA